jgi:hypothetical protein
VAEGDIGAVRRQLHDRPYGIRVRVDQPRRLAAGVAVMESVAGLKISQPDTVLIETTVPEEVYDHLQELILREGLIAREISAADENLEAVFGYLTDRR